ncbi:hypothetical protein EIK77_005063 [Talaromyces pinophilus]|nr:hypothetical protein EIK77_005063 [Talaromyces pinophilus]
MVCQRRREECWCFEYLHGGPIRRICLDNRYPRRQGKKFLNDLELSYDRANLSQGGSIRGFLNDGTIAYNQHSNVDSLAFGHCDYAYRNLGRPSVIKIEQSSSLFQVTVDDKVCFQTSKVILPAGNQFGVTAATPDNPDSFELFKFVVTSGAQATAQFTEQTMQQQQQQIPIESRSSSNNINLGSLDDMNSRIQQISQEVSQITQNINDRHQELLNKISTGSVASSSDSSTQNEARLNAMDERLRRIETMLSDLQRDNAGKDYRNEFTRLHKAIENSHHSLTEALQTSIFNSELYSYTSLTLRSTLTIDSDHRYNTTHGPLHLRRDCLPTPPRGCIYILQASTQWHAKEVLVNGTIYTDI